MPGLVWIYFWEKSRSTLPRRALMDASTTLVKPSNEEFHTCSRIMVGVSGRLTRLTVKPGEEGEHFHEWLHIKQVKRHIVLLNGNQIHSGITVTSPRRPSFRRSCEGKFQSVP
jgi:hypothetical protein